MTTCDGCANNGSGMLYRAKLTCPACGAKLCSTHSRAPSGGDEVRGLRRCSVCKTVSDAAKFLFA